MNFWNKEYKRNRGKRGDLFHLSTEPSGDLLKFTRWLERHYAGEYLNSRALVLDVGTGNGRNLIYLAKTFVVRGVGLDLSRRAIAEATTASAGLPLTYHTQSATDPLPATDGSVTLVLDMMTSHFLTKSEREALLAEILRVLTPGGWLFYKTFLRDGDRHAERLLREHPAPEPGSYRHPAIGLAEHVSTEAEIVSTLEPHFTIHKITKSHNPQKRRSISVYAQKD